MAVLLKENVRVDYRPKPGISGLVFLARIYVIKENIQNSERLSRQERGEEHSLHNSLCGSGTYH